MYSGKYISNLKGISKIRTYINEYFEKYLSLVILSYNIIYIFEFDIQVKTY